MSRPSSPDTLLAMPIVTIVYQSPAAGAAVTSHLFGIQQFVARTFSHAERQLEPGEVSVDPQQATPSSVLFCGRDGLQVTVGAHAHASRLGHEDELAEGLARYIHERTGLKVACTVALSNMGWFMTGPELQRYQGYGWITSASDALSL